MIQEKTSKLDSIPKQTNHIGFNESLIEKINMYNEKISNLFKKCYHLSNPVNNPLGNLTIIENDLHSMSQKISLFDKTLVTEALTKIQTDKRKEYREKKREQKRKEFEIKRQRVIERATRPIIQKIGRPLNQRITIQKKVKKNDTARELEILERERIEKLLFGDVFD